MHSSTFDELATVMGGRLLQGEGRRKVARVTTDTRKLRPGDLFVALTGEHFDGHDFVARAVETGATGVVVSRTVDVSSSVSVLLVPDTLAALQALAAWNRRVLSLPVVAVTGSTGKTTTKDFIAAVLGSRWPVVATRGNYNNEIGVPLTLLEMDETTGAAVVEMGMRGPREIDFLSGLAAPTAAVITNIGEAHIERLGSVENIVHAKGEVLPHLPREGFALLHIDSPLLVAEAGRTLARVVYFGESQGADYRLISYRAVDGGSVFRACWQGHEYSFHLPVVGRHNAVNALAAVGVGLELGLEPSTIAQGLAAAQLSPMRQAVVRVGALTVINDVYNANPASVKAALTTFWETEVDRMRVAVLGDMLELGPLSATCHRGVGSCCAAVGLHLLVTVGEQAREIAQGAVDAGMDAARVVPCATNDDALAVMRERLTGREAVLVKGSRGMHMEDVVTGLTTLFCPPAAGFEEGRE